MATESSVVVALKEVRRLEIDRQRRQEESRRQAQENERIQNEERRSVQYGPGMTPFGNGWETSASDGGYTRPVHRTSEVMPVHAASNGNGQFMPPQAYLAQSPPSWEGPGFASDRRPQKAKSSWKGFVVAMLLCGGAAAGGLWKQNQDFMVRLNQAETARYRAEEARNLAVAEGSKAARSDSIGGGLAAKRHRSRPELSVTL